ncbi:mitochondrial import inner membrane translocase subunit Tim17/Tim22/Tim23 family protein isoform X1 [Wolffia australiana]
MPREEDTPCASLAVESVIRLGGAGLSWGFFYGPYEADRKGIIGKSRASLVAKTICKCGLLCGIAAGTFSATSCRAQRYRMKKDRINSSIAGAVTGAALALRTRSLKQIVGTASAISALATVADFSTA